MEKESEYRDPISKDKEDILDKVLSSNYESPPKDEVPEKEEPNWEPEVKDHHKKSKDSHHKDSKDSDHKGFHWDFVSLLVLVIIITILFLLLSYPTGDMWFTNYIPDSNYRWLARGLIFFIILLILLMVVLSLF